MKIILPFPQFKPISMYECPFSEYYDPFCFLGPPSCLALFYNDGGEDGDEVLYGTADGKVGLVQLTR